MNLKEFVDKNSVNVADFCRKNNIAEKTFYNVMDYGKDVLLSTAMKIEKGTKRKVKCQDLAIPPKEKKPSKKSLKKPA